jgi:hypothetical protein
MSGVVAANTTNMSAASAFATHTLRPVIRYPSPSRTAVVRCCPASVPALGSDNAKAPSAWPDASRRSHPSRWLGLPKRATSSATRELFTARMTASVALARAISSMARA